MPASAVVKELKTSDAVLKETLLWIAGRHPQWGPAMADFLRELLASPAAPDEVRLFRVTPMFISVLDYSKGFGHTDLVTC